MPADIRCIGLKIGSERLGVLHKRIAKLLEVFELVGLLVFRFVDGVGIDFAGDASAGGTILGAAFAAVFGEFVQSNLVGSVEVVER